VSPAIAAPIVWNYDVCFQYPGFVGNAATVYMPCTSAMPPRRYLIVQLEAYQFLNFCEIEVYVLGELIFVCRPVYSQRCKRTTQKLYNSRNNNTKASI